jgi:hypothetical protein
MHGGATAAARQVQQVYSMNQGEDQYRLISVHCGRVQQQPALGAVYGTCYGIPVVESCEQLGTRTHSTSGLKGNKKKIQLTRAVAGIA